MLLLQPRPSQDLPASPWGDISAGRCIGGIQVITKIQSLLWEGSSPVCCRCWWGWGCHPVCSELGSSFQESCPSLPGYQAGLSSASRFPGSLGADECMYDSPVPRAGSASDSQVIPCEGVLGKCPTAASIPLTSAALYSRGCVRSPPAWAGAGLSSPISCRQPQPWGLPCSRARAVSGGQ